LNFWAVVEYIVKYAMKGPDGSKQLKDVLRDTFDEICRYNRESQADDLLKKSLQKFYSRTLGDRDYIIFEVMFLGLRLPLVNGLMPMDCLNTSGARVLKSRKQLLKDGGDGEIAWKSKIDKFDDRLGALRRHLKRRGQAEDWKYWRRR